MAHPRTEPMAFPCEEQQGPGTVANPPEAGVTGQLAIGREIEAPRRTRTRQPRDARSARPGTGVPAQPGRAPGRPGLARVPHALLDRAWCTPGAGKAATSRRWSPPSSNLNRPIRRASRSLMPDSPRTRPATSTGAAGRRVSRSSGSCAPHEQGRVDRAASRSTTSASASRHAARGARTIVPGVTRSAWPLCSTISTFATSPCS